MALKIQRRGTDTRAVLGPPATCSLCNRCEEPNLELAKIAAVALHLSIEVSDPRSPTFEECGRCEDVDGKYLGVRYPTHIATGSIQPIRGGANLQAFTSI